MRTFNLLLLGIIIFLGTSCTSQKKLVNNYLQNMADTTALLTGNLPDVLIQKNDILSIKVYSMSINPATDIPYNLPESSGSGAGGTPSSGFLVDQKGDIDYPRLGTLHVEGLTKEDLANLIKQKLEGQLTQPSVIVRFTNHRVTILGEVRSPGTYTVSTDRITILEALGMAGDITEYGKKNNVKILRENNGQREISTIDLTSKDMFNSPFYLLKQNDVVMVEQTQKRLQQEDRTNLAQQIGIATSIITAVALILNFIK
ncbi:MAG: polysaccharide biosynthesis/export family protein [Flavisolibacter sp.]